MTLDEFKPIIKMLGDNFGPAWYEAMSYVLWEDFGDMDAAEFKAIALHARKTFTESWPISGKFKAVGDLLRGSAVETTGRSNDDRWMQEVKRTREQQEAFKKAEAMFERLAEDKRAPYLAEAALQVARARAVWKATPDQEDILKRRFAVVEYMKSNKEVVK